MWPQFTLRRACMFASSDDQVITDQENPAKKTVRTCCSNSRVLGSVSCFNTYLSLYTVHRLLVCYLYTLWESGYTLVKEKTHFV